VIAWLAPSPALRRGLPVTHEARGQGGGGQVLPPPTLPLLTMGKGGALLSWGQS